MRGRTASRRRAAVPHLGDAGFYSSLAAAPLLTCGLSWQRAACDLWHVTCHVCHVQALEWVELARKTLGCDDLASLPELKLLKLRDGEEVWLRQHPTLMDELMAWVQTNVLDKWTDEAIKIILDDYFDENEKFERRKYGGTSGTCGIVFVI